MGENEKKYVKVLVPRPFDEVFDYEAESEVPEGSFVEVPFGKKTLRGVVWSIAKPELDISKIKRIENVLPIPPMNRKMREFVEFVADYNMAKKGSVLAQCLTGLKTFKKKKEKDRQEFKLASPDIKLSDEQKEAAEKLKEKIGKGYSTTLLDGVTGSGKTEVYLEAIRKTLEERKQVLVLLPEIVLTNQIIKRFEDRFGITPSIWHSSITPKTRRENFLNVLDGGAKLLVGARSSLFLPFKELGLIVVDEEHETSYKQEDGVIYHGRDMAVARANIEKIPIILVSASPSVETILNVKNGKFDVVHLKNRHGKATMPDIKKIDMRQQNLDSKHFISNELKEALIENFENKEQSLLYLNRRGYAPLLLCRKCGFRFECHDCSAWLVEHKKTNNLQCHHCGFTTGIPDKCPSCESEEGFAPCGPGVERMEEEVKEFLPDARISLMTSDEISDGSGAKAALDEIEEGKIDVIIGTQMVAKGHHFPNLTLVGVVDADLGLEGGDLRAAEKSFQLLHQVSGRAGREKLKGRAIIQSYMPDNSVMNALASGDKDNFVENELSRRKKSSMPPFSRMGAVIVSSTQENIAKKTAQDLARIYKISEGSRLLGPAPAPIYMLRGNYRYRLLLISNKNINIQKKLKSWMSEANIPSNAKVKLDIDPQSFM